MCWIGTAIECFGLESVRPRRGTYGRYSYQSLPHPLKLHGDLGWLADEDEIQGSIADELASENAAAVPKLLDECARLELDLPSSFRKLITSRDMPARIRSITDCMMDIAASPYRAEGYWLIRFLSDSQGCVFWYLALDESSEYVIASNEYFAPPAEQWQDADRSFEPPVIVADCFEEFVWRFWIENEIRFADYYNEPLSSACQRYVDEYLREDV